MKDVTIIEDVLPKAYWQEISHSLSHPGFPWHYSDEISIDKSKGNPFKQNPEIISSYGFSHTLYSEGKATQYWAIIKPILYFMSEKANYSKFNKPLNVYRAKINLQTQVNGSHADNHNMPHVDPAFFDNKGNNWVFLYYVNDADGDTFLFNETADKGLPEKMTLRQRVTPKANSGILFRDNIFHASSNPVKSNARFNINFNILTP